MAIGHLPLYSLFLLEVGVSIFTTLRNKLLGDPKDIPVKQAGLKRSPKWPGVRAEHLKLHSLCAACGTKTDLEVHHQQPFHLHPEKELDLVNLITLCSTGGHNCHLVIGHSLDFTSYNAHVKEDAEKLRKRIQERPKHELERDLKL